MIEQLFYDQPIDKTGSKYFWDKLHQDDEDAFNYEVELKFQEKTNQSNPLEIFIDGL